MDKIEYYKSYEVFTYKFFQMPQELFYNPIYKYKLSLQSKMLYGILMDRLTLSIKNNWYDKDHNVYIIYTREEAADILCSGYKVAIKAFKELLAENLIKEKKQGMGKANLIFLIKPKLSNETCQIYTSLYSKVAHNDMSKEHTINTNNINTENINPNSDNNITLDEVKIKCDLVNFKDEDKSILTSVIDKLYNSSKIKINGIYVLHSEIINKLKLVTKNNLLHLLEVAQNNSDIKNLNNYLVSTLYNNLGNNYSKSKKLKSNFESRNYDNDYLESFYSNM